MAINAPDPQLVTGLLDGVYPAFAMLAGLQLDVFTPLSQRSFTTQQLAEELQVDSARLARLLFALAQAGLLDWDGASFSATTETAVYLNRQHPQYMAGLADFSPTSGRTWFRTRPPPFVTAIPTYGMTTTI